METFIKSVIVVTTVIVLFTNDSAILKVMVLFGAVTALTIDE